MKIKSDIDVEKVIRDILSIRFFEESLDKLFEKGEISGTFHRCIGQEATCVGVTHLLDNRKDFVVSNHRNHGHYLGFTGDYLGLINELKGRSSGVTGGKGGSQVLFGKNFFSTGILGSTVGIASGIALAKKLDNANSIVVCFMGDGVFGQGIVYESLNMCSLWELPILFVVEQNNIAQSTSIEKITAGSIMKRFESFGIESNYKKSTDVFEITEVSSKLISKVKKERKPCALIIEANRLSAHSKGDDDRDLSVIKQIEKEDPLLKLSQYTDELDKLKVECQDRIERIING